MFRAVTIRNFRGFDTLILDDMQQLNIVTGRNGSGKTALLEALFLNCGPANAGLILSIANFRGDEIWAMRSARLFRPLFHRLSLAHLPLIQSTWETADKKARAKRNLTLRPIISKEPSQVGSSIVELLTGVELEYSSNRTKRSKATIQWEEIKDERIIASGPTPPEQKAYRLAIKNEAIEDYIDGRFVISSHHNMAASIHAQLTQLTKERKIGALVDLLGAIDSRVRDILPLTENNENVIYLDLGFEELLPLTLEGEGIFNILNMSANFATLQKGVVFIDEIENGLHYSVYKQILRFILSAIRERDIQVFITTHSDDFISAAAQVCEHEKFEDVCSFRFVHENGRRSATRFGFRDLLNSRDMNMELR